MLKVTKFKTIFSTQKLEKAGFLLQTNGNIKSSLNGTTHGYCTQVELQFRPKLTSSTHKSFKIPVKK